MKKGSRQQLPEDSLERYDLSKATRGRYAGKLATGTPWRRLEDDLAQAFPTSNEVNEALRALLALRKVIEPRKRKAAA